MENKKYTSESLLGIVKQPVDTCPLIDQLVKRSMNFKLYVQSYFLEIERGYSSSYDLTTITQNFIDNFREYIHISQDYLNDINENIMKIDRWNEEWNLKLKEDYPEAKLQSSNFSYGNLNLELNILNSYLESFSKKVFELLEKEDYQEILEHSDIISRSAFTIDNIESLRQQALKVRKEGQDFKDIYKYYKTEENPEFFEKFHETQERDIESQNGILKKDKHSKRRQPKL